MCIVLAWEFCCLLNMLYYLICLFHCHGVILALFYTSLSIINVLATLTYVSSLFVLIGWGEY